MIRLSAPSKTFLIGEYAILNGGCALLASTPPRFSLQISSQPDAEPTLIGFHSECPAAKLVELFKEKSLYTQFEFIDPHLEKGGFGASGAQFLLTAQALCPNEPIGQTIQHYRHITKQYHGYSPSGSDIISQYHGHITYISTNRIQSFDWPFPDITVSLIRTHANCTTHEHLQKLNDLDTSELELIAKHACDSFQQSHHRGFLQAMNDYSDALAALSLTHPNTLDYLSSLKALPFVLASKGCGALGADVICVLTDNNDVSKLNQWLENYPVLSTVFQGNAFQKGIDTQENNEQYV